MRTEQMLDKLYQQILQIAAGKQSTENLTDLVSAYQVFSDINDKEIHQRNVARTMRAVEDNPTSAYNRARIKAWKNENNVVSLMRLLKKRR